VRKYRAGEIVQEDRGIGRATQATLWVAWWLLAGAWVVTGIRSLSAFGAWGWADLDPPYHYGEASLGRRSLCGGSRGPNHAIDPIVWYSYLRRQKYDGEWLLIRPNDSGVVVISDSEYRFLERASDGFVPVMDGKDGMRWDFIAGNFVRDEEKLQE
jgi:hypothetical protein